MSQSTDDFWAAPMTVTLTRQQWQCIFAALEISFARTIFQPEELHSRILEALEKVQAA